MAPKVAIVFYSTYGHVKVLAEAEQAGLKKAGIDADIFQISETLLGEVLSKLHAGPKSSYLTIDATPLRSGFWDKYVGLFIGTATQGDGQDSTTLATMSTLANHGMIFVSLGYKTPLEIQSGLGEARGGSPWRAGTYIVGLDGSQMPSALELELTTVG